MLRVPFVLPIVVTTATAASSPDPDRSRWGVSASFAPEWSVPSEFKVLFDADTVSITGSEFRIGFVRGRMLGGDWGVTLRRCHSNSC